MPRRVGRPAPSPFCRFVMINKRYLPYIVVGLVVLAAGWWIFRPKQDSVLALKQFAPAMFRSKGLGCARISNGTELLDKEQASAVMREIVRPMFAGIRLESVKAERRSEGHSSALITASSADGKPVYVALNAFDLEDGGAIPLFMMLQKCWQVPVIAKLGTYPKSESAFDVAYLEGIRSAGPKLERIGVREIFGPQGKFMTTKQIEEFYAIRVDDSETVKP